MIGKWLEQDRISGIYYHQRSGDHHQTSTVMDIGESEAIACRCTKSLWSETGPPRQDDLSFHEDKTPSFQVYWRANTCYCFSSNCPTNGKSMDAIDFIMHQEKCSKHEAIKLSEAMLHGEVKPQDQSREAFLMKMFTYFQNAAYTSGPAREYIASRVLDYHVVEIG